MRGASCRTTSAFLLTMGLVLPVACGGHNSKGTQGTQGTQDTQGAKTRKPSTKPTCQLLYKRNTQCRTMPITAVIMTRELFVQQCRTKGAPQYEVACSTRSDCTVFKSCTLGKRLKRGDWNAVEDFCQRPHFQSLDGCKGVPAKATRWLHADITRKRDAGQVQDARCWDLKRFAKKVGAPQHQAAELLCREVALTRIIVRIRNELKKGKQSKHVPWFCQKTNRARFHQPSTAYVKKLRAELEAFCQ